MMSKSKQNEQKPQRVGIYAGTFDPVHAGHIAFTLQAIETAGLDQVLFLPERIPRHKAHAEHFGHRVAMLKQAVRPYPNMGVLELTDKYFTVQRTWPQLKSAFSGAQLVMLVGSDVLAHMPDWPGIENLLQDSELVVGARADGEPAMVRTIVQAWPVRPQRLHIIQSHAPGVSSTSIRQALARRIHAPGLLTSVHGYAKTNWLYVSIEHALREKA